jgi:hypothetical protein
MWPEFQPIGKTGLYAVEIFAVDAEAGLEGAAFLLGPERHRVGGRHGVHPLAAQRLLNVVSALQQQEQGLHEWYQIYTKKELGLVKRNGDMNQKGSEGFEDPNLINRSDLCPKRFDHKVKVLNLNKVQFNRS